MLQWRQALLTTQRSKRLPVTATSSSLSSLSLPQGSSSSPSSVAPHRRAISTGFVPAVHKVYDGSSTIAAVYTGRIPHSPLSLDRKDGPNSLKGCLHHSRSLVPSLTSLSPSFCPPRVSSQPYSTTSGGPSSTATVANA